MIEGIGIDVVNIDRIGRLSEAVKQRLFHPRELEDASALALEVQSEFLAGRFAAKEALGKALGTGLKGISLQEIWVEKQSDGSPKLCFAGRARVLVGSRTAMLSISHDQPVSVAVVLLQGGCDGSL